GAIEGADPRPGRDNGEDASEFDYLGTARSLAAACYPRLLDDAELLDGRTLIFELIHPLAKKVTDYGERSDLILLGCFDMRRLSYATYPEVVALAEEHGLTVVDALSPQGTTLAEQIDNLLNALSGTDQEGSVLQFENPQEAIYRVKVKSPDYLRLMRAMAECTYENLAAFMDDNPHLKSWQDVEGFLRARGREAMPEEVLGCYRPHYERFTAYLAACERLCRWAMQVHDELDRQLGGRQGRDAAAYRKSFAALATRYRHAALLFAALDGRLDRQRLRRLIRDPKQVQQALSDLGLI
ncbi:MAG TPA: RNA ligase family protein, partial [Gemmataceae bacterium]|nr:RNA ligase family protein [Gemmataceae bacterium]